jgi:FtsH-binding integral membrane protein
VVVVMMSTFDTTYDDPALGTEAVAHDRARALLGEVMGYVAVTVGFAALGAYLGRDLSGPTGLLPLIGTIPVVIGLNVAATGAYGYATRRDLSSWGRTLFWALLGLIAFGIVAIFVSIPNSNIIYAVAGIGIFGAFTIYDFNRLRRSNPDAAVPIAAGIFLDVFNVFLLALDLFGGRRD